jgi:CspA family cold shock protein
MTGTIKKKTEKGYGFISSADLPSDLFFHSNSLVGATWDEIQEGDTVSFEVEEVEKNGEMKKNAINVQRA